MISVLTTGFYTEPSSLNQQNLKLNPQFSLNRRIKLFCVILMLSAALQCDRWFPIGRSISTWWPTTCCYSFLNKYDGYWNKSFIFCILYLVGWKSVQWMLIVLLLLRLLPPTLSGWVHVAYMHTPCMLSARSVHAQWWYSCNILKQTNFKKY